MVQEQPLTVEEAVEFTEDVNKQLQRRKLISIATIALVVIMGIYLTQRVLLDRPIPQPDVKVASITGPGQWAMSGGDAARTASIPTTVTLTGREAWRFSTGQPLLAAPVLADGEVYLPTAENRLVALKAEDGTLIWEYPTTGPVDTSPLVTQDAVIFGLRDGRVIALSRRERAEVQRWQFGTPSPATGTPGIMWTPEPRVLWEFPTNDPVTAPPLLHEGVLYVGSGNGKLYALDALNGEELWSSSVGQWFSGSPAISGDVLAVATIGGNVNFIDWKTGNRRLLYVSRSNMSTSPTFVDKTLAVTSDQGMLLAVDSTKVEYAMERNFRWWRSLFYLWGWQSAPPIPKGFIWDRKVGPQVRYTSPAVADGVMYVGASTGQLRAVRVATGADVWSYTLDAPAAGAPIVAGDLVYIGTATGQIHVVRRSDGSRVQTISTPSAPVGQLVIAGDTLYAAGIDGTLVAIK